MQKSPKSILSKLLLMSTMCANIFLLSLIAPQQACAEPVTSEEVFGPVYTEAQAVELISEPITGEELINMYVDEICSAYTNVDPYIVKSIIWQESRYQPDAVNYDGSCVGLMQISTYWNQQRAAKLGVTDYFDSYSNILLGVDFLSELFDTYSDETLVLMLYSMNWNAAFENHSNGVSTTYVDSVQTRAWNLRNGGV